MQPRRPDSAKSRVTQKTLDTQLNQSKFSQTFTSYTTFQSQKKDQFLKYLQQKDRDPKFRKYHQHKDKDQHKEQHKEQQTNLPQIAQKPTKQQLSKINSKPFQKRGAKITGSKPKIQQQRQLLEQNHNNNQQQRTIVIANGSNSINSSINNNSNSNVTKPNTSQQQQQQSQLVSNNNNITTTTPTTTTTNKQMNLTSKSFAEKNKQKMSSTIMGKGVMKKIQIQMDERKKVQKKIQFKGFKVNQPGVRREREKEGSNVNMRGSDGDGNIGNDNMRQQHQVQNEFLMQSSSSSLIQQQQKQQQKTSQQQPQHLTPTIITKLQLNNTKTQQQKHQQQQQQLNERQQQLLQISRFINQVEQRNVQNYPQGYQEFVEMNNNSQSIMCGSNSNGNNLNNDGNVITGNDEQNNNNNNINIDNNNNSNMQFMLNKIDINTFLIQPTQSDYIKVQRRIKQNQKRLLIQQRQQKYGQGNDNNNKMMMGESYVSKSGGNSNMSRSQLAGLYRGNVINSNSNNNNNNILKPPAFSSSRVTTTNKSSSQIDLDNIIDGDYTNRYPYQQQQQQQLQQQQQQQNTIFLSQISSQQLKQRNLFLTEILKGRVTKQQINKLQQMNKSQLKLHKLQHGNNNNKKQQQQQFDTIIDTTEINMVKRNSNRLLERNIIQASGQIYRDCDYLSEDNKIRLERLLNGEVEGSPFILSEWEQFAIRRLDEGIRLYREFSNNNNSHSSIWNTQNNNNDNTIIPPQQLLPKDPTLRKQAQRKILKQKLSTINNRLQQIQHIVITKSKIHQLITQYQHVAPSQMTQSLIDQRNIQIMQIQQKSIKAKEMLDKVERQKGEIENALRQMQEQFQEYEKQCNQYQKLTVQQIVNLQKQQIRNKRQLLQQIQKDLLDIEKGTQQTINEFHQQLQKQIDILREIENVGVGDNSSGRDVQLVSRVGMTVEELDEMFEKRVKDQGVVEGKRLVGDNINTQQGKQNEPVQYQ